MRALIFHFKRHLSDVARQGPRVLVRKARYLPRAVRGSWTGQFLTTCKLTSQLILNLLINRIVGAPDQKLLAEKLQASLDDLRYVRRSEESRLALQIRNLMAGGLIDEAKTVSESLDHSKIESIHLKNQIAQAQYLTGNWKKSVAIRGEIQDDFDQLAASSWLRSLNTRFISGAFIGHIGHLGLIDLICRARHLDLLSDEKRVFVGMKDSVANLDYLECWRNQIDIHYMERDEFRAFSTVMSPLIEDVTIFRLKNGRKDFYSAYSEVNRRWMLEGRMPLIRPDEEKIERSKNYFKELGVDPEGWFVGLHVRGEDPHWWTNATDSDILTYLPMIEMVRNAGGSVIRIGDPTMKPLPQIPGLVDYAHAPDRSKSHDVYVWSQCRFFIGTGSGPMNIPHTFGRPSLLTNYPSIGLDQDFNKFLSLPKLVRDRSTKRLVRFEHVLKSPFAWSVSRHHKDFDYEFVDNSCDELMEAAEEMIRFTSSDHYSFSASQEQSALSDYLYSLGRTGKSSLPASFLLRHEDLWK